LETYDLMRRLFAEMGLLNLLVGLLIILTGIRVYLSVQQSRLLRSIDRSLKLLPGVARNDRRAA
jgi:hypothetical protein